MANTPPRAAPPRNAALAGLAPPTQLRKPVINAQMIPTARTRARASTAMANERLDMISTLCRGSESGLGYTRSRLATRVNGPRSGSAPVDPAAYLGSYARRLRAGWVPGLRPPTFGGLTLSDDLGCWVLNSHRLAPSCHTCTCHFSVSAGPDLPFVLAVQGWSYVARRRPPLPECTGRQINCANCRRYARRWRERVAATLRPDSAEQQTLFTPYAAWGEPA